MALGLVGMVAVGLIWSVWRKGWPTGDSLSKSPKSEAPQDVIARLQFNAESGVIATSRRFSSSLVNTLQFSNFGQ